MCIMMQTNVQMYPVSVDHVNSKTMNNMIQTVSLLIVTEIFVALYLNMRLTNYITNNGIPYETHSN